MSTQPHFDGSTYQPEHDGKRLAGQFARVRALMLDGRWRTLREIAAIVHGSEAGISARLRQLRDRRFGRYIVERRRRGDEGRGIFEYAVRPPEPVTQERLF